ncbi:putative PAC domain-containing protein [Seiridium unicorne]|uniref:PAC domain-containing protein n=1 Tax=Seiridium unicorne TaxID=138068 RepID=A0ABR2UZK2_9PEZI
MITIRAWSQKPGLRRNKREEADAYRLGIFVVWSEVSAASGTSATLLCRPPTLTLGWATVDDRDHGPCDVKVSGNIPKRSSVESLKSLPKAVERGTIAGLAILLAARFVTPNSRYHTSSSHHKTPREQNTANIHSISAFGNEHGTATAEPGAEIPDIPLRKSSRSRGLSVVNLITSPPFRTHRKAKFTEELDSQRPVSPSSILPRESMSPPRVSHEDLKGYHASQEPEYIHDPTASRSPSTAPKSLMSKSSHSHLNSSASSAAFANGSSTLPALQTRAAVENDGLEPLAEEEIDPASFDLVVPAHAPGKQYSLETQSELLFSAKHLEVIFEDPVLLQRFTNYIYQQRPESVPILQYYMDTLKALKAIEYANSVVNRLQAVKDLSYTSDSIERTMNHVLRDRATSAFETLANQELPAYITHTYIQTVSVTIKRRIADTLPPNLREMSEGLAEVFCLTDPARPDNPIIFASEEFHRTTQYGMSYVLGRNCRFLQGPKTNPFSVRRLREKLDAGKEHCETFLNYRRDGQPFMNLLMVAPLYDSRGIVRYHIGAQVDVSGLVRDCAGLDSLGRLVERENAADGSDHFQVRIHGSRANGKTAGVDGLAGPGHENDNNQEEEKDEFRDLASMFSLTELKTVREHGGSMHRIHQSEINETEGISSNWNKPRLLIKDDATIDRRDSDPILNSSVASPTSGKLSGVYEHYLLVRPYPSLKILFASPSLRVPGMLQSNLMSRIGGSSKVREAIAQAFADGNGVTAKVRWISRSGSDRGRWIHATPLLGSNGAVGVWMVVLVDDEQEQTTRTPKDAPPVERYIRGGGMGAGQFGGSVGDLSLASLASFGNGGLDDRDQGRSSSSTRENRREGSERGGYETAASLRGLPAGHRRTPALNGLAMHSPTGASDGGRMTPDTVRFDSL